LIRAVISDFGGVLTSPLIQCFVAYQERTGVDFARFGTAMQQILERDEIHPLYELECGRITEDDFYAMLERELGGEVSLAGFRDTWFETLTPNEPMIELMRSLRERRLRTALLTNNIREWEPHWRAKIPAIDEIFEVIVDSAFVGMRKPDPRIYELTLERLGDVRPEECVFVDDVDVNCAAAEALGMRAVHFTGAERAIGEVESLVGTPA
jgi:epoxide hydrolase-like predicted phosphatase